ncbi:MAG: DUF3822 family protein [Flammeovirgaceae bacterium TMED290]|nr:MAG: DUF3822 family protein [Flammeovirgaceae bacterium TMED290]
MSRVKKNKFYILEDLKILFYFIKSDSIKIKKGKPKADKNSELQYVSLTNKFYIVPNKLEREFDNIKLSKTIASDFDKSNTKENKIDNLTIKYKTKFKSNNTHISKIIISHLMSFNTNKDVYFSIIANKIILVITYRKKLVFYNQFDLINNNYIKYLILLFDEFKLNQRRDKVYYISSNVKDKKVMDELRPYFYSIINYEKSIFDIIIEDCE